MPRNKVNIKSCCITEDKVYKKVIMQNGEVHIAIKCSVCDKFFSWARRTPRTMALADIDDMTSTVPMTNTERKRLERA